jgi:precorrin-6Y C5,15-methyltransferase (decarboxylating)
VVELAFERLRPGGRLVASVGSIESLSAVHQSLERAAKNVNVWMINVARGTYQLERVRFEALNPTFLLGVVKDGSSKSSDAGKKRP